MNDKPEFKRENRYIVIKRSHLERGQETRLLAFLDGVLRVQTISCVVVETDWPEYEPVWKMLEARITGAAPVPPAGGDVKGLGKVKALGPYLIDIEWRNGKEPKPGTELVDRAHVTRLQAEVERLGSIGRGQRKTIDNVQLQVERLQSELTKALELLADVAKTPWMYDVLGSVREYVANQSAPADKGHGSTGEDVARRLDELLAQRRDHE